MAKTKKKLSPEERKRLEAQLAELQEALDEEEEAKTPEEQAAADAELAEQRRRTAELFDKLDLTEEDYDLLVGAFTAGSEAELRRIVREELDAQGGDDDPGKGKGKVKDLEDDPAAPPVPKDDPPEPPPASSHWTNKKLWGSDEVKP